MWVHGFATITGLPAIQTTIESVEERALQCAGPNTADLKWIHGDDLRRALEVLVGEDTTELSPATPGRLKGQQGRSTKAGGTASRKSKAYSETALR